MTNKIKDTKNCRTTTGHTETRDAVENAIDKSKENKRSTWESISHKTPNRVGKWQERSAATVRDKVRD